MGWHIHTKNGKFNIWSTIIDDYILNGWGTEEEVKKIYIERRLKEATESIKKDADELFRDAVKDGFCSVFYVNMHCTPESVKEIQKFKKRSSDSRTQIEAKTDE